MHFISLSQTADRLLDSTAGRTAKPVISRKSILDLLNANKETIVAVLSSLQKGWITCKAHLVRIMHFVRNSVMLSVLMQSVLLKAKQLCRSLCLGAITGFLGLMEWWVPMLSTRYTGTHRLWDVFPHPLCNIYSGHVCLFQLLLHHNPLIYWTDVEIIFRNEHVICYCLLKSIPLL